MAMGIVLVAVGAASWRLWREVPRASSSQGCRHGVLCLILYGDIHHHLNVCLAGREKVASATLPGVGSVSTLS